MCIRGISTGLAQNVQLHMDVLYIPLRVSYVIRVEHGLQRTLK